MRYEVNRGNCKKLRESLSLIISPVDDQMRYSYLAMRHKSKVVARK